MLLGCRGVAGSQRARRAAAGGGGLPCRRVATLACCDVMTRVGAPRAEPASPKSRYIYGANARAETLSEPVINYS